MFIITEVCDVYNGWFLSAAVPLPYRTLRERGSKLRTASPTGEGLRLRAILATS
ncbi:hypothetical protein [Nostoc punctiforme]|uniref:hypothetical protein n=1 Tax=Nostoc punctiforme TaxID=272131 RepID=UPI000045B984|nr:hypothetical protein [Nostoc punctiforme]